MSAWMVAVALGLVAETLISPTIALARAGSRLFDPPLTFLETRTAPTGQRTSPPGIALAEQHPHLAEPALAQTGPEGSQLLLVQVTEQINLSQEGNVARLATGSLSVTWPSASS